MVLLRASHPVTAIIIASRIVVFTFCFLTSIIDLNFYCRNIYVANLSFAIQEEDAGRGGGQEGGS